MHTNPAYHELAKLTLEYITLNTLIRLLDAHDTNTTLYNLCYNSEYDFTRTDPEKILSLKQKMGEIQDQIMTHIKKMGIETNMTSYLSHAT